MRQLRMVICLASLLLLSGAASAQEDEINTIAGGGPNNVSATSANVPYPLAAATDNAGNFYFADGVSPQSRVFKVTPAGTLTVLAGNGFPGYSGDGGPAPQAQLNYPRGIAVDSSGDVFIADTSNCVVREVSAATGNISTFAGNGYCTFGGYNGGAATSAYLYYPYGVAVDSSGNVYIADLYGYILEVSGGNISIVAGTGSFCDSGGAACGDGGAATSASFSYIYSLAIDGSGNLYFPDFYNYEVREFSVGGNIQTVAGNDTFCDSGGAACGDGGSATSAELSYVYGIAADSPGNIFIADYYNYEIREVTGGNIYNVAGGYFCWSGGVACGDGGAATSAGINYVFGLATDSSDDIYIPDYYNYAIREVTDSPANTNPVTGNINTVAGNGTLYFAGNNIPATGAELDYPEGATSDSAGNIYIADTYNCIVREVSAETGIITTIAGTPGSCGYGGDGGAATSALLNYPRKVAAYEGNVYIADASNCVVREVNTSGTISTFAGTPGYCGYAGDGGAATSAYLSYPEGVATDGSGNVFIADYYNQRIREVSNGIINTVAGNGGYGYSGDGGPATSATFYYPIDVAVDAWENIYIADTDNLRIRKVNAAGIISTLAGNGSAGYEGDGGPANEASIYYPEGVAVDGAGDVVIADTSNSRVRWVDGLGIIHTVAGNGDYGFFGDGGIATSAWLADPEGVGVDPSGNIYVADTYNNHVRKVNAVAGLNASTYNVTFEYQVVGTESAAEPVTLTAVGPLEISNIAVTGNFSESDDCPRNATVSQPCVVHVFFTPTQAAVLTGTVTISDNGYFTPSVVINLTGYGTDVTVAPTSLAFGNQNVFTTSAAKVVHLTNKAPGGLTMGAVSTTNSAFVVSSNTCTGTIASHASCSIGVEFAPKQTGPLSGSLVINDSDGSSPQEVEVTGDGTGGATLTPASLSFAPRDGGTTSAPQTLTLTNELASTLNITGASFSGPNASDFAVSGGTCPYPSGALAGNSSCTYTITFTPSASGGENATFSVTDSVGTQSATLRGTGIGATIAPTTTTFAAQDGGTTSAAKTLTFTNYLSTALAISVSFGGANPGDFAVSGGTCPYPSGNVAASSSCTFNVTFTPSINGAESATLSVSDVDGTQNAALKGTGVGATLTPATTTFAAQTPNTTSAPKTVTLTNYLSSPLSISGTSFGGANSGNFAIASTTCTSPLAASSSCTYSITFTPSAAGAESATFSVTDADGTQTVALKGTGK